MDNIKTFEEFHDLNEEVTIENDMIKIEGFMKKFSAQLQQIKYMLGSDPEIDKKESVGYVKDIEKAEKIFLKTLENVHDELAKKSK